jgi:hypothetical protein
VTAAARRFGGSINRLRDLTDEKWLDRPASFEVKRLGRLLRPEEPAISILATARGAPTAPPEFGMWKR